MAARKNTLRKKNPTSAQWMMIGVGSIAIGAVGYALYQYVQNRRARAVLQKLPPPPVSIPTEPQPPLEGMGEPIVFSECGEEYPGFVYDGEACVPSQQTPGGIYVNTNCDDFVFVARDHGPQVDRLEEIINEEIDRTKDPGQPSANPTDLATGFFEAVWPGCPWPPLPNASDRMRNLYQAIVLVIGNSIVADGGRVLGTTDPGLVQEQIEARLQEMGYETFDPGMVPEIKIPEPLPESVGLPPVVGIPPQIKPI